MLESKVKSCWRRRHTKHKVQRPGLFHEKISRLPLLCCDALAAKAPNPYLTASMGHDLEMDGHIRAGMRHFEQSRRSIAQRSCTTLYYDMTRSAATTLKTVELTQDGRQFVKARTEEPMVKRLVTDTCVPPLICGAINAGTHVSMISLCDQGQVWMCTQLHWESIFANVLEGASKTPIDGAIALRNVHYVAVSTP